jgi:hypothetical protein
VSALNPRSYPLLGDPTYLDGLKGKDRRRGRPAPVTPTVLADLPLDAGMATISSMHESQKRQEKGRRYKKKNIEEINEIKHRRMKIN